MTGSTRLGIQITSWILLVAGLVMFLWETRSAGEALETFKLSISLSTVAIAGAVVVVLSVIALVALYVSGKRKNLQ